jgi:drug/metabolite transporter (DMT)-like permease
MNQEAKNCYYSIFLYLLQCLSGVLLLVNIKKASFYLKVPGTSFLAYRTTILFVLLLPFMIYKKFSFMTRSNIKFNVPKDVLAFVATWLWYMCATKITVNDVVIISFLTPMWVVVFSSLILKEKHMLGRTIPFIILSLCGVMIAVGSAINELSWFYLTLIAASMIRSLSNVSIKISSNNSGILDMFLFNIVITCPLALLSGWKYLTWDLNVPFIMYNSVIVVLYIIFLFSGYMAVKLGSLSHLQPYDFSRLPMSFVLSYVILHEKLYLRDIVGSSIVIISSLAFFLRMKSKKIEKCLKSN